MFLKWIFKIKMLNLLLLLLLFKKQIKMERKLLTFYARNEWHIFRFEKKIFSYLFKNNLHSEITTKSIVLFAKNLSFGLAV